jgi:hypothetical protein
LLGAGILTLVALAACKTESSKSINGATPVPVTKTFSLSPTNTATLIPTSTSTLTPTIIPSLTPTPQTLGPVFPAKYQSLGVSANRNTGSQDSQNTHYDVIVPPEYFNNPSSCNVISPVNGKVREIYQIGNPRGSAGSVIAIDLSLPPQGIEQVLTEFNINPTRVNGYSVHLGHLENLNPEIQVGVSVEKGTLLANSVNHDPEPKVAYVLYIWYGNNKMIQVSPCSVANYASFCGVCYQYDGFCPETNMNFPDGGIQWWNEGDPFWDTH